MARTRRTAQQWQGFVDKWQQGNLSITEFCEQEGLAQSNFYQWKKKLLGNRSVQQSEQTDVSSWLQLPQTNTGNVDAGWDMELSLPGGVVLRMRQAS